MRTEDANNSDVKQTNDITPGCEKSNEHENYV
jgi:hypothetical protein